MECHIHLKRDRLARMKWAPEKWVFPGAMVKSLHGLQVSIAGGRVKGWIGESPTASGRTTTALTIHADARAVRPTSSPATSAANAPPFAGPPSNGANSRP